MRNPDLIELALRVVQGTKTGPKGHDAIAAEPATDLVDEILEPAPQEEAIEVEQPPPIAPESAGLARPTPVKEKKTADELATMILDDLNGIEGCPRRGVKITVYGSNPWNAWMSFAGAAGPVRNKADLQGFCEIITERLKRLYDIS